VLYALAALLLISFYSCEMEEETEITPQITFNYPANNQQIPFTPEVKILAQLKGFTEYRKIDSVLLSIDDSIVHREKRQIETIEYHWNTRNNPGQTHTLAVQVHYTDETPADKDWNFFGARDYIEEEEEPEPEKLSINTSISVSFSAFPSGSPSLSYTTFERDTFEYQNKTIVLDSFKISKYEITAKQYADFLNDISVDSVGRFGNIKYIYLGKNSHLEFNGTRFVPKSDRDSLPITTVTWAGAQDYCRWAGGRLPTQAEWYYASDPDYVNNISFVLNDAAWFKANSNKRIHKIGTKDPNSYGIYDMLGNASEWCLDWYSNPVYSSQDDILVNPVSPYSGELKVQKGGSWNSQPFETNIELRTPFDPNNGSNYTGFRIVKQLD
jgi:formylglycine-generating enzyme required for sulfatase activity